MSIARAAGIGTAAIRAGGTGTVVVLLVAAVLTTTMGAASAADSTSACQRSDTGTVEGVTVTGLATVDGDCVVASETLVVTFDPSTPTATLGLDAFVVVDSDSESVDDELANVDVRDLGDGRYRVEIPRDSLTAAKEPGDDVRLQVEIRTRTVLSTGRSDVRLVQLDVDVGADGTLGGGEGTDDTDGASDGDDTSDSNGGTDDAGGDGASNGPDEDSGGDGSPDSGEGTGDADDDGTSTSDHLDGDSGGSGIPDSGDATGNSDGDGTSDFSNQADGSTGTPTPTLTPTPTQSSTPTPTAVGTPSSDQDSDASSGSPLSAGVLTDGGLPWLVLVVVALVALLLGWRQL